MHGWRIATPEAMATGFFLNLTLSSVISYVCNLYFYIYFVNNL